MHLRSVGERSMLLGVLCLILGHTAMSQDCLSKLEVANGRHTRTISSEDPTRYYFVLTNQSDVDKLYTLSVEAVGDNCLLEAMPARRLSQSNPLIFNWKHEQGSGDQLKLKAGQSAEFQLQIALLQPLDDPLWQCLSVVARNPQCRDVSSASKRLWMEPHQTDND